VPGKPTAVNAARVGTSTSATISWTGPSSTGGSPVLNYLARATQDTAKSCISASVSCTISGLANGVSYTFVVRANNAVGSGAFSDPSAPLIVALFPGTSGSLLVSGFSRAYRFTLTPAAAAATGTLTMTISDMRGRMVWTRVVHPSKDGATELVWNGRNLSGQLASAGVYLVKVTASGGGQSADYVGKAADVK
jgi:hypothetical protein